MPEVRGLSAKSLTRTHDSYVYVVDDDAAVRDAMCLLLTTGGWPSLSCPSAEHFLSHYQSRPHQCVILDIELPGCSGIELQSLLRKRGDTVPVIVVSAHHDHPDIHRAHDDGALVVLSKPFDHHNLMQWVDFALSRYA